MKSNPKLPQGAHQGNGTVRVAIVGVGNCSSSLIQGVQYYAESRGDDAIPGLMHHTVGGYHISDIEFVAAFDVDTDKVGKDLSEAIFSGQNNTVRFSEVPGLGVEVMRGELHDGIGRYLADVIDVADVPSVDVAQVLRDTNADVLINFLPVGSEIATRYYMEQALAAGVGVVNCIPVFIAREQEWRTRFEEAGVPIVGDDIKSQVGATIVHRRLVQLMRDRGIKLERTSQLNVGGNTDFRNMLERDRLQSKKISKTNAVTSVLAEPLPERDVHVGPSDYVPWLEDRKWAHIRLEGRAFGDVPLNMEVKLEVVDSPNSAGITIDAVRMCKLALDRGVGGALEWPSAYMMKSPPWQHDDDLARDMVEAFIHGEQPDGVAVTDAPADEPVLA